MATARYRQFLRLCEEWPLDKTKTGRDLATVIRQRVGEAFKQGEASQINEAQCDEAFEHLNKINMNAFKQKYERTSETGATGAVKEQCTLVVSTEALEELNNADMGFVAKMKRTLGFAG
ncbi:ubiquinol-cytochrome-c reductase complex assembly factor 2-like [Haliotis rubra]|uniref:ubiquinol-cytochrome-c reductase complex assembly factor 2-like n=1 Tax=Haliotis rubra TaxID=36100 RepID=UPI001EE524C2|nr:ubiquinol-cytochrome-c reductase complex assembly factor 2-like [Haliotis rubra]